MLERLLWEIDTCHILILGFGQCVNPTVQMDV